MADITSPKTVKMTSSKSSAKTSSTKSQLPASVFGVDVHNHVLLKLAYDAYLANSRRSTAVTKTRGDVSGGGKKPWKQKGTGRARFGSSRNPIWRTGGVVFGPNGTENYTKTITRAAKHTALRQALTLAAKSDKIVRAELPSLSGKTAELATHLATNQLTQPRILIVVDQKTPELLRAAANIPNLLVVRANYLSVYHILNADRIAIDNAALDVIEQWLAQPAKGEK